jgi:hypothetical protein
LRRSNDLGSGNRARTDAGALILKLRVGIPADGKEEDETRGVEDRRPANLAAGLTGTAAAAREANRPRLEANIKICDGSFFLNHFLLGFNYFSNLFGTKQ